MSLRLRMTNLKLPSLLISMISLSFLIYFGQLARLSCAAGGKGEPGVSTPSNFQEQPSSLTQINEQALLLEEAKRRGIDHDLDLSSVSQNLRPWFIIQRLKQEICGNKGSVAPDEISRYYREHAEEFIRRPQIRIHHLLIEIRPAATEEERKSARQGAQELLSLVEREKEQGNTQGILGLAAEFSKKDPEGKRWGDLGWFSRGHFSPDFDKAVFSLKRVGDCKFFETELGYHIVQLMDKRKPRAYALREVEGLIEDRLRVKEQEQYLRHLVEELRSRESPEGMVFIPGGTFWKGPSDEEIKRRLDLYYKYVAPCFNGKPPWWLKIAKQLRRNVTVKPFYIDRFEVTIGEYREFIKATGYRDLPAWVSKYSPGDNYPVVGVSWYDAGSYAEWKGKRLPVAGEWEFAARGSNSRPFPWGNELPDGLRANYCDYSCKNPWRAPESNDGYQYAAPVGSYPKGITPEGVYDLAGNVREWTSTVDIESGKVVVKGGSYFNAIEDCMSYDHRVNEKELINHFIGFRCAKDK